MKQPHITSASRSYTTASDLSLLESVLSHDPDAWQELLSRFRGLIFRCITKVLCRYESVLSNEDVNEVFSQVCENLLRNDMRKLRRYDPERGNKLGSWIGLISVNTAYDHLRVTARQPLLDRIEGAVDREDSRPSPLEQLLEKERRQHLTSLASDFSGKDRRFMELYYGQGLSPVEVARRMNISVKTVYSKKNKIRTRLVALASQARGDALAA